MVNKSPVQPASVTPKKAVEEGSALASTLSPNKSRHNRSYMSVKDIISKGSPVARQLFQSEISALDGESTSNTSIKKEVVNMNRLVQKTGKVSNKKKNVLLLHRKYSIFLSGKYICRYLSVVMSKKCSGDCSVDLVLCVHSDQFSAGLFIKVNHLVDEKFNF